MQKTVTQYDSNGNLVSVYNSVKEAASKNNLSIEFLYKILRLEKRLYKGFIWLSTEKGKPVLKKIPGIPVKPLINKSLRRKLGLTDMKYPFEDINLIDLEGEIWLPVPNYEEYYMVSNMGRIKKLSRWVYYYDGRKRFEAEKIAKQYINRTTRKDNLQGLACLFFRVRIEKNTQTVLVARAVYSAFVKKLNPIYMDKQYVLHHDLDGFNNCIENLYLATTKEFFNRNIEAGLFTANIENAEIRNKVTERKRKPVSQFSRDGQFVASYPSIREATRQTGIDDKSIINTAKGKQRHAKGFIWRYITNKENNISHF